MTVDTDLDARRREAASWFARLNQKRVAADDITGFSQWRRAPENAAAYARIESLWEAADTLAGDPDITALSEAARARADASRRARNRLSTVLVPIGALAGLGALTIGIVLWSGRGQAYETGIGEQRAVVLADGSRVTLDTASRIRVKLTPGRRDVELVSGQAFFDVQGDARRPFVVTAGDADVTAIGTRFDVRRLDVGVRVTLVQGKVEVRDRGAGAPVLALTPGQQVVTAGPRPAARAVDAASETSWTTGRLVFDGDTVGSAVAEVNRYTRDKIRMEAPGVAGIAVSGAFNVGDVDGFVSALTDLYPVTAARDAEGRIVLRDAAKKNPAVP